MISASAHMSIPFRMSPRPKLIPVPAIWAPKSNLGLIFMECSFMDRGPMLMFKIMDFCLFLVVGSTTTGTSDEDSADWDGGFVVLIVLEGVCSVGLVFIVWYLFEFVLDIQYVPVVSEGPDTGTC